MEQTAVALSFSTDHPNRYPERMFVFSRPQRLSRLSPIVFQHFYAVTIAKENNKYLKKNSKLQKKH